MQDEIQYEPAADRGAERPSETPIRWLLRRLRGRHRRVAALGALLAVAGAIAGHFAVRPKFESRGFVRIDAALPPILYSTQESQVPPMFEAFVASQVAHLQSRPILEAAVASAPMREVRWPGGEAGFAALQQVISVHRPRGAKLIYVSATHHDPRWAHAAVNAVLEAYHETEPNPVGLSLVAKEQALVPREERLQRELEEVRIQIFEISDQHGTGAVDRVHASTINELLAVEQKLEQIRLTRGHPADGGGPAAADVPGANRRLTALEGEELELVAQIRSSIYRPGHSALRHLEQRLATVRVHRKLLERAQHGSMTGEAIPGAKAMPDELEQSLTASRDRLREEARQLARTRVTLAGLRDKEVELKNRLTRTRTRLDEIRFEASRENPDWVSVTHGDLQVTPVTDRRAGLAAAGSMCGVIAAVALVIFPGLINPRVRFADDLEDMDEAPCLLAVLPDLGGGGGATEGRAAHSIHRLRGLLDPAPGGNRGIVHAFTSGGQNEGKTDLALALGRSFAAAGRRTLLVDTDFADPRLSRVLRLADRPGLGDALGGGEPSGTTHPCDRENLWGMPIGPAAGLRAEHLSRRTLDDLLTVLRGRFDVILIDTGPVHTAIEASYMCAMADSTVLVVARGRKVPMVRSSLAELDRLGASVAGLVFNKAAASDLPDAELSAPEVVLRGGRSASKDEDDGPGPIARLVGGPEIGDLDAKGTWRAA